MWKNSMEKLAVFCGLISTAAFASKVTPTNSSSKEAISVVWNSNTKQFDVIHDYDESYDAYGYMYRNLEGGYWNFLDAYAQQEVDSVEDHLLYSKALGFLEGYVTCPEIKTFYPNFYSAVFGTDALGDQTIGFLQANFDWLQEMVKQNAATDNYWYTIQAVLEQLQGVYEGYVAGCGTANGAADYRTLDTPTLMHFLLINAWGDLYQITMKYVEPGRGARLMGNRGNKANRQLMGAASEQRKLVERCSAIINFLGDKSDIVFGHSTWDTYESLGPRILKHYSFPLMRNGHAEHHYDTYFSSSPALLSSIDDFFVVSGYAKLGVQETTNSLYNLKLLELVVPSTVLSWTRAVTSNQLAETGSQWPELFAKYHSGTYTNQWMVLDLSLFTPGQSLPSGFMNIFEEVPGLVHYEDMTATLNSDGYWASYNIPYFQDIAEASGYAKLCERDFTFCHDKAPRADLFRQHHSNVTDITGGDWILSYNNFQNDVVSLNDSCDTIACRGDLEPSVAMRGAYGALDSKVSSVVRAKFSNGQTPYIQARLGPTLQQPMFCWSQVKDESSYVHNGQPDCFDFPIIYFPPN